MFDGEDVMRETQNGFGKGNWKGGQKMGGLEPDDEEDSDEEEGVDDDDDDEEEEGLEAEEGSEESDHNF